MKRLAWLILFVPCVASAQASEVVPLSNGWSLHRGVLGASAVQCACARERAFVLDSAGSVAMFHDGLFSRLPQRSSSARPRSIAATPDGHAFLDAGDVVVEWDGARFVDHALERFVRDEERGDRSTSTSIAAPSAREVYYVGRGRIAVFDGARFGTFSAGTWRSLSAVASVRGILFVGGQGGTILRHASGWSRERTGTGEWVRSIVAFAPDDLWAIAGEPLSFESSVLHYDGRAWSSRPWTGEGKIATIGGTAERVYATNNRAGLLRWADDAWVVEIAHAEFGEDGRYYGVSGVCATDRHFVVGFGPHALVRER